MMSINNNSQTATIQPVQRFLSEQPPTTTLTLIPSTNIVYYWFYWI